MDRVRHRGPAEPLTPQAPHGRSAVAIVGASGALGFGLALRLGRAGVPIVIGSREPGRISPTLERARRLVPGGSFLARENAQAVREADTVILAVPYRHLSSTLAGIRGELAPGQLLIDTTVPLAAAVSGRATRMLGVWEGSAAQQTRELVPGNVAVVSALHTVSAASLTDLEHPLEQDVLLCGDSGADKRRAAGLMERIEGLRCVDCGALELSRTTEALTALLIDVKVRYTAHAGLHLTGLETSLWD